MPRASQISTPDGQRLHRLAGDADAFADLRSAILGLIVADNSTANNVAVFVENPERVEAGFEGVLQDFFCRLGAVGLHLAREIAQARERAATEIVHERLRLLGGDFERAREPAAERAVEQGIADEKHEHDGQERKGHRADDHLCFEAGTELIFAAFGPETEDGAREDEAEDEKRGGDETGNGVQPHDGAPVAGFDGDVERAEGEDGGEEEGDGDAADDEGPALAWAEAHASTVEVSDFGWSRQTSANAGVAAGCGRDATGVSFAQYRGCGGKSRVVGIGGATPVVFLRVGKWLRINELEGGGK